MYLKKSGIHYYSGDTPIIVNLSLTDRTLHSNREAISLLSDLQSPRKP